MLRMELKWVWFLRIALAAMTVLLVLADPCLEHERIALLQLKPFFNHHNELADWDEVKGSNCCEWMGIECNTTTRRLIGLSLSSTRYSDEGWYLNVSLFIPFVELKSLYLPGNAIAGCIENEGFQWLSRLNNLETLDLSGNSLKNNIMLHMKGLSSLKTLSLSGNRLKGNLLHIQGLENLTNLKELDLSWNGIESLKSYKGCCDLKKLEVLDLSWNAFEGMLPNYLGNLTSLRELDVCQNHFSGNLTPLANLTSLRFLSLSRNHFEIPTSFAPFLNLPNLKFLYADENKIVMEPSFHSSLPKFQLRLITLPNCITSQQLRFQLLTFLYYQYDLRYVDLSGNKFSGALPIWLLQNNTKLKYLILRGNAFSGLLSLPSAPNLNVSLVDISDNKLQGQIPSDICSTFPHLKGLFLSKNAIEGDIPPCLSAMNDLLFLDLSNNHLSGTLPEELIMNRSLTLLRLSNNNLSGNVIPAVFKANEFSNIYLDGNNFSGDMTNVDVSAFDFSSSPAEIDLSNNKLYGKLPGWIGNLTNLKTLALSNNSFEGSIPMEFCNLNRSFSNMFSGPIPSCLGNLTLPMQHNKILQQGGYISISSEDESGTFGSSKLARGENGNYPESYMEEWIEFTTKSGSLSYGGNILENMTGIDLSCNKLTGKIPPELGNLSEIHSLNLSHNNLIGVIPSSFSKLKQLESLDLSYNDLSGEIPNQLVDLTSLEVFSVAHNNLSGNIPEPKAQFGTFDETSYEGNPFLSLCGSMLYKNCSKTDSPSSAASNDEDSLLDMYVFRVSFLVSYAVMLLATFIVLYINPYWRRAWFSFVENCISTCRYSTVGNFLGYYIFRRCV
ncbi:hypothetical protein GQ457_13G028870 [Hibiscus cannabinus]